MAKTQTIESDFVKVPDFTQFQAEFSKWAGDFGKYTIRFIQSQPRPVPNQKSVIRRAWSP
jgi:hypothetical protein